MRFRLLLIALTAAVYAWVTAVPWFLSDRAAIAEPLLSAARPLTALTFAVVDSAPASHLLQLALHLACVLLAAALFDLSLEARAARIASLVFALHPLQVEAVCSLSGRATLLAAALCMGSWLAWRSKRYWLSAAVFAAAPLAHEQAALFPLVLLVELPAVRRPLLLMGCFGVLSWIRAPRPALDLELTGQLGVATLRDLWLFLLPIRLTPAPELRAAPWAAAFAWGTVAAVTVLALASASRSPYAAWMTKALGLLVFAGFLAPMREAGTDRLMYLPMTALAALAGLLCATASTRILVAVGLLLAFVTVTQVRLWTEERAVWTEAVRLAPHSAYPRVRLAAVSDSDFARTLLDEARTLK